MNEDDLDWSKTLPDITSLAKDIDLDFFPRKSRGIYM